MDARLPDRLDIAFHDGVLGRMRSRSRGEPCDGVPELVLVHGMTACDYLLPGLRELSAWTRVHLIDLPGCGGSGDPPHELGVAEFAGAVVDWLAGRDLGRVVLVGHSSGTQVAAEVARRSGNVAGVVLASPVFDPAYRSLPLVLWRWALDLSREPPSLERSKPPRPQTSRRTATAAHPACAPASPPGRCGRRAACTRTRHPRPPRRTQHPPMGPPPGRGGRRRPPRRGSRTAHLLLGPSGGVLTADPRVQHTDRECFGHSRVGGGYPFGRSAVVTTARDIIEFLVVLEFLVA
jgi:pimeloyl-ACP methyl ester carboxylesterase